MDIAAMSIGMSQAKVQHEVGVSVLKMAMDTAQGNASDMAKIMDELTMNMESVTLPHMGRNIDIRG